MPASREPKEARADRAESAILGRDTAHRRHERLEPGAIPFQMDPLSRGRMLSETRAGSTLGHRTDRPRHEAAATVGTDIEQHRLHAIRAERALIAADAGVSRIRRQVLVAILAV